MTDWKTTRIGQTLAELDDSCAEQRAAQEGPEIVEADGIFGIVCLLIEVLKPQDATSKPNAGDRS